MAVGGGVPPDILERLVRIETKLEVYMSLATTNAKNIHALELWKARAIGYAAGFGSLAGAVTAAAALVLGGA